MIRLALAAYLDSTKQPMAGQPSDEQVGSDSVPEFYVRPGHPTVLLDEGSEQFQQLFEMATLTGKAVTQIHRYLQELNERTDQIAISLAQLSSTLEEITPVFEKVTDVLTEPETC